MEKKKISTLDKVVGIILIIALIGAGIYFRDAIELIVNSKIQSTKIEDQIAGLENDESESWTEPFYTCKGHVFSEEWLSLDGNNFDLIENAFSKSESNCIWFENLKDGSKNDFWEHPCNFYNVDDEEIISKIDNLNGLPTSFDGTFDIFKTSKSAQKFLLRFNKDYRLKDTIDGRIERAIDEENEWNKWRDSDWDGMNVDDFYKKYKIKTSISQPTLKKILTGSFLDGENGYETRFVKTTAMLIEFEMTNISSEKHPLEWFPQSGETKTVAVMIQGTFDPHGNFCLEKAAIYK